MIRFLIEKVFDLPQRSGLLVSGRLTDGVVSAGMVLREEGTGLPVRVLGVEFESRTDRRSRTVTLLVERGPTSPVAQGRTLTGTASTVDPGVGPDRGRGDQMRMKARWMLILAGRIDQTRLDELRRLLELRRKGRLTDREDAHMGTREMPGGLLLDLWRNEDVDDEWSIKLSAYAGAAASEEEIVRWRARAEEAAVAVGLAVVEFRSFPAPPREDYQTAWRNENWPRRGAGSHED